MTKKSSSIIVVDSNSSRMEIYYGGADTVVCLASAYVDEIVEFVKTNNMN